MTKSLGHNTRDPRGSNRCPPACVGLFIASMEFGRRIRLRFLTSSNRQFLVDA